MKGIKLRILGICIGSAGMSLATNNIITMSLTAVGTVIKLLFTQQLITC